MFALILFIVVSITCHTNMLASALQEPCNDIIHVQMDGECLSVCDDTSCGSGSCKCFHNLKFDCNDGIITLVFGYWYDNNVSRYTLNCPGEYCDFNNQWYSNDSSPDRNEQCRENWEGIACGECKGNNSIIFDSFRCVSSNRCYKYGDLQHEQLWVLVFLTIFLYWCTFILVVVTVLKFKFDTSIGYVYGLLFYYSVLENVVKQKITDDLYFIYEFPQCDRSDIGFYILTFESKILSSLASIGNLKPPYLQFMNLCLNTQVIDHVVFVYTHPVIVVSLLAIIAVAARKSFKLTKLVQRHSTIMICLILLLSYSSISYTSVQLLKPLIVYDRITGERKWHLYWSPSIPFADGWRLLYIIVAVLCIVIISIGLPLLLLLERTFASKFNLNLTRIKPILDQLQGCYKDKYRWFAAYYLICRQVIYICDLVSDFLTSSTVYSNTPKHTIFLLFSMIIMMIHIWFQPYKRKSLNVFDSAILMILLLAIFASQSNNYILRITLWFLPLELFLCYMTYSTKLKHFLIPLFCLGTLLSSSLMFSPLFDMQIIALIIVLALLYYLIKHIRETCNSCRRQCRGRYSKQNNDDDDHIQDLYIR